MTRSRFLHGLTACLAVAVIAFASRPTGAASSCEWNGIERVVAIGDVHGAYDQFVEILKVTGVLDNRLRWAGGATHVVQLGDILDRGDDSRKALDLVRRLEKEAQAAGGRMHQLLGNHEAARMLGDLRLVAPGEYAAFVKADSEKTRARYLEVLKPATEAERAQLLQEMPLGFFEMRLAFGRDGEYGRWLRRLPATVKIDGIMFVHGGISPAVAPLGCDAINDQVRRDLTGDLDKTRAKPLESLTARVDGPLWYRGLALEGEAFGPEVNAILAAVKARAIVVGHTVAPTGRITARFDGRVVQIDTGMQPAYVKGGRASALEIRGGEATAIYVDRRDPVALAKPAGTAAGAARHP